MWSRCARLFGSIKLRITLAAIAAMAAGVALATVVLVHRTERDMLARQRDAQLAEVVGVAHELSARVVERQRALSLSAVQLDAAMLRDEASLRRFFEHKPLLRHQFANVFVATATGRMLLYADTAGVRRPGIELGDRDYFRRTVTERRPIVSEPVPGRISGEPVSRGP